MKKILCCSPYMPNSNNVSGGIAIWTAAIYEYYKAINSDIDVEIFPFTRKFFIKDNDPIWKRLPAGLYEYGNIVKKLKHRLKKNDVDAIHVCSSASISLLKDYLIIKAAHAQGVKVVMHFHFGRIPELSVKKNWEWKLIKKIISLSDVSITMDLTSFETLKKEGFSNVRYLPNPLSNKAIEAVKCSMDSHTKVYNRIAFVGHGYVTKGVYELVKGIVNVPQTSLRIVGRFTEDMRQELVGIASERDNGTWLSFVGEIPHNEVLNELSQAELFVFPSYTEGFPYVILEAMATRCAIVSTGVGAIPEMLDVDGDECGVIIPVKDSVAVTREVSKLVNDREYLRTIANRAYNRVYSQYSISEVWKHLYNIWIEV